MIMHDLIRFLNQAYLDGLNQMKIGGWYVKGLKE